MLSITFHRDGTVGVYASHDGSTISVTCAVNQLQQMLPGVVFAEVLDRMHGMLALMPQAARIGA